MSHQPGVTLKPLVQLGKEPGDCWMWLGATTDNGYPNKTHNGKSTSARRWLYQQLFGPLPESLTVIVSCDNKGCVNPAHFAVMSLADAQRRGVNTVLLPKDVHEIRAARKNAGPTVAAHYAEKFDVSVNTIRDIWGRRSWCSKPKRYDRKKKLRHSTPRKRHHHEESNVVH